MSTVVLFSGGAASYIAAKRQVEKYGKDNVTLLFTDTRMEDVDLYRFLRDAETVLGVPVTEQSDGRDVWQVFFDERYLGNSRIDPCSKILKRQQSKKFMAEQDSEATTVTLGITWNEKHRLEKMHRFWEPFKLEAPLTEPPYLTKQDMLGEIRADGIEPPGLYEQGFAHNNCGGACVKAGKGQWAQLYREMPERYLYHEEKEQELREYLGKEVAILKERVGGEARYVTLMEFRKRLEAEEVSQGELLDVGGCGCFAGGVA